MNFWKCTVLLLSLILCFSIYGQQPLPDPPPVAPHPEPETIFKVVEEMPRFPGCEHLALSIRNKEDCAKEKMLDYIYEVQQYPEEAEKNGTSGMAVAQFTIWKDSTIRNIKVVRNPGDGIGIEAQRIVESMKHMDQKWIPGRQRGQSVCVQYTLPIKFKLENQFRIHQLDKGPIFPDCIGEEDPECTKEKLAEFIRENQLYPEEALKHKTEGFVEVVFLIGTDGQVSGVRALNKLENGLSEDAVEIIRWMNSEKMYWRPGQMDGDDVITEYQVTIEYNIKDWLKRN